MIDPTKIVVPSDRGQSSVPDGATAFERIERYDAEYFGHEANQQERAIALIQLCLIEGIDTKPHIIGMLIKFGLSNGHIANVLKHGDLANTKAGHWLCDDEGVYRPYP